jgi:hypothetical protein
LFGFCETVMVRMQLRRHEMEAGSVTASEKLPHAGNEPDTLFPRR